MRKTLQTGPITARDIEELVLRLHEIQVRCGGGLINLTQNVAVGYYTLWQPELAQCSQQVKVLRAGGQVWRVHAQKRARVAHLH